MYAIWWPLPETAGVLTVQFSMPMVSMTTMWTCRFHTSRQKSSRMFLMAPAGSAFLPVGVALWGQRAGTCEMVAPGSPRPHQAQQ